MNRNNAPMTRQNHPLRAILAGILAMGITAFTAATPVSATMAASHPHAAVSAATPHGPTRIHSTQWSPYAAVPHEADVEDQTNRLFGVGALALGLAAAFSIVLLMFDRMMRTRSRNTNARS
jgi:hypothetical protein